MTSPREINEILEEIRKDLLNLASKTGSVSKSIIQQLEKVLANWYSVNNSIKKQTMLSESLPGSKEEAEKLAQQLNNMNTDLAKKNKELITLEKSLEELHGSVSSSESAKETARILSLRADQLNKHSQTLLDIEKASTKNSLFNGRLPKGTDVQSLKKSIESLQGKINNLLEQNYEVKQQQKMETATKVKPALGNTKTRNTNRGPGVS